MAGLEAALIYAAYAHSGALPHIVRMCGSDDEAFADSLLNHEGQSILVEYKRAQADAKDETNKPLRKALFDREFPNDIQRIGRRLHFLAWGSKERTTGYYAVELQDYLSRVGREFGKAFEPAFPQPRHALDFADDFIAKRQGASNDDLLNYLGYLARFADFQGDPKDTPMRGALICAFDDASGIRKPLLREFHTVGEFLALAETILELSIRPQTQVQDQDLDQDQDLRLT